MTTRRDLQAARLLFTRFLGPVWKAVIVIVGVNLVVGFMLAFRPLVLAPVLEVFVGTDAKSATTVSDLSLNNLGPTLIDVLGLNSSSNLDLGIVVAILFVLVTGIIAGLTTTGHVLLVHTRTAVLRDITTALHRHLLTLPLAYFQRKKAGDLVSRLTHDVAKTTNFLDGITRGVLKSAAHIGITLFVLFRTDPMIAFSVIGLGSVHVIITRILSKPVRKTSKESVDEMGNMSASLLETFVAIRVIKSFAAERYDAKRVYAAANRLREFLKRFRITTYYEVPIRMVADALVIGSVLILVFYAVSEGRLTIPAAAMFMLLAQQITAPTSEFFSQALAFQNMLGGASKIIEIFETKSTMKDGVIEVEELKSRIAMENVNFSYDGVNRVLDAVNLEIKRGEVIAIVGSSGSGKSTLVDLVLRLYDVTGGRITYDGTDIRDLRQREYRRRFGVVAQECLLFNGTVRENIVYNRKEVREELEHALWAANANEFVQGLSDGLETLVGDRGTRLSGGQRQRIAIARAIYSRPSILVLDEATSSLDSESEHLVQEAISRVSRELTTIVIAHRLSTITNADKIVVLNGGKIEATGMHKTLLQKSSTYTRLCNLQFNSSSEQMQDA